MVILATLCPCRLRPKWGSQAVDQEEIAKCEEGKWMTIVWFPLGIVEKRHVGGTTCKFLQWSESSGVGFEVRRGFGHQVVASFGSLTHLDPFLNFRGWFKEQDDLGKRCSHGGIRWCCWNPRKKSIGAAAVPTKTRPCRTGKHHGPEGRTESKICVSRGRNVPSEISYKKLAIRLRFTFLIHFSMLATGSLLAAALLPLLLLLLMLLEP